MDTLSLTDVEQFEGRPKAFLDDAREDVADAKTDAEMQAVREKYSRDGALVFDGAVFDAYEAKFRERYDQELLDRGIAIEADREALLARIDRDMAAAEVLPSAVTGRFPADSEKSLLAQLLDRQERADVRAQLAGLTFAQVAALYDRATDTEHNIVVRVLEEAAGMGTLEQLGIVNADATETAGALMHLQTAIKARRAARVPKWLHEARERVLRTRTLTFTTKLDHLRQGRGIARRPKVA